MGFPPAGRNGGCSAHGAGRWARPGGRGGRRRRSAACEGGFFSNQENTPSRFPRKIVRGDGVVTSSISLAAAQRAPAHSFRCSSFSHRKTLRWEPCISPLTTPLKRPKERPAGLSFGNLLGVGRRAGLRGTVGRGTRDGGGVRVGSFRGFRLGGDEVEESLVVLAPGLGGWGPAGDGGRGGGTPYLGHGLRQPNSVPEFGASVRSSCPTGGCGGPHQPPSGAFAAAREGKSRRECPGQPAHSGAIAAAGRGRGKNRSKKYPKRGVVATSAGGALSEAESTGRGAGQIRGLPDE